MTARTFTLTRLTDVEPIAVGDLTWLPLRRALGATGFGIGAWTAADAGDELIESHDETSTGAGAQQELYVVFGGRATFTVGDQEIDAPTGTLVLVEVGTRRSAVAAEPDTTVLVVGGRPGAALPASPFEHYYAAQPAYDAGDFDRANGDRRRGPGGLARPPADPLPARLLPRPGRAPRGCAAIPGHRLRG
jgi:hypothetical protein